MGALALATAYSPFRRVKATNFATSFQTVRQQKTEPTFDGLLKTFSPPANQFGGLVQNWLLLRPYGTDANDEAFNMRVWGMRAALGDTDGDVSYEFQLLAQFACTLGNIQGAANCLIGASDFECDTITLTYGATADVQIVSPANNERGAWCAVDMRGCVCPLVDFDMNSSAASANALWARG
jgi:hypothetical protein